MAQLAPGGMLLVNLRLNLSSIFLLLKKVGPTTVEGHLFDLNASYMEMHSFAGLPPSLQVDWKVLVLTLKDGGSKVGREDLPRGEQDHAEGETNIHEGV